MALFDSHLHGLCLSHIFVFILAGCLLSSLLPTVYLGCPQGLQWQQLKYLNLIVISCPMVKVYTPCNASWQLGILVLPKYTAPGHLPQGVESMAQKHLHVCLL